MWECRQAQVVDKDTGASMCRTYLCKAELSQQQLCKDWQQQGVLAQGEGHLLLEGGLLHQACNSTSGNTNTNSCRQAQTTTWNKRLAASNILQGAHTGAIQLLETNACHASVLSLDLQVVPGQRLMLSNLLFEGQRADTALGGIRGVDSGWWPVGLLCLTWPVMFSADRHTAQGTQ
jgi:hypothetical protein